MRDTSSDRSAQPGPDIARLWARIATAGPLDPLHDFGEAPFGVDGAHWRERAAHQTDRRWAFTAFYAWAVPTPEAIEAVAAFVGNRRLLEVCAGQGLWALLLSTAGVNVVATDASCETTATYFPVALHEAEAAVKAHLHCEALMLGWPPFRNNCAYRALRVFQGDRLAYVGDQRFTADRQFQEALDKCWRLEQRIMIPTWPGLDDYVYLHSRRE